MLKGILLATGLLLICTPALADPPCTRTVSFALADGSGVHPFMGTGNWIGKWIDKNAKKYVDICFSQSPLQGRANYMIVLSQSAGYYTGFDPVVRTETSMNTTPVSGAGTISDNSGGMWNYTYNGTQTTTTTTTTHENIPYTVTSNAIFAYAYSDGGAIVSRRTHVFSTRSGGDSSSTAGYNLGSALAAINARGRLLADVVKDIEGQPTYSRAAQTAPPETHPTESIVATQPPVASAVQPSSPCKAYSGPGKKQSIVENAGGTLLVLSDGSIWQVTESDKAESSVWLDAEDVVIMHAEDSSGCFAYALLNANENAARVRAQYLGQK
jgi:hypothetical protein